SIRTATSCRKQAGPNRLPTAERFHVLSPCHPKPHLHQKYRALPARRRQQPADRMPSPRAVKQESPHDGTERRTHPLRKDSTVICRDHERTHSPTAHSRTTARYAVPVSPRLCRFLLTRVAVADLTVSGGGCPMRREEHRAPSGALRHARARQ